MVTLISFLVRNEVLVVQETNILRPLPTHTKSTKFIFMRKITATLCLPLAVILAGAGTSASADFQKNAIALTDLIQRNGLFYKLLSPTPYTGTVWGQKT